MFKLFSIRSSAVIVGAFFSLQAALIAAKSQTPEAISASGEDLIVVLHAQGSQIYECAPDSAGRLRWQFREPVATLIADGLTIGRHYAGPSWELADGSLITGKAVARAPAATSGDIPWLKLEATAQRPAGRLARTVSIQRINTKGGVVEGACDESGALMSAPYAADYVFLRKRS